MAAMAAVLLVSGCAVTRSEVQLTNQESALAVTDGAWTEAVDKAMAKWRTDVVARKAELP